MESSEEKYLIQRAKAATDPNEQKSIILTAKTLYPQNFKIQFMAYVFGKFFFVLFTFPITNSNTPFISEKQAKNYDEAAKSLSHL